MYAITVHTADLQGLDGISLQERQRLGHLQYLDVARQQSGTLTSSARDLDFELCGPHLAS